MKNRHPEHASVELAIHGSPSTGASISGYLAVVVLAVASAAAIGFFHWNKACQVAHASECSLDSEAKT